MKTIKKKPCVFFFFRFVLFLSARLASYFESAYALCSKHSEALFPLGGGVGGCRRGLISGPEKYKHEETSSCMEW